MTTKNDNFIMLPTVDFCFKKLMDNPKIRKGFVAAIMGMSPEELQDTYLQPTELTREHEEDKQGYLDVLVVLKNGTKINLEMQVRYFAYWSERILYYLSSVFSEQIKRGDRYDKLQKCIHVSILDFIHFPEDQECYRKIHFRDDKTGKVYSDKMEIQILELKKLSSKLQSGEDIISWMRFFNGRNKEDFADMAKTNEYLEEAYETLVRLSEDEEVQQLYRARRKAQLDHEWMMHCMKQEGLEAGRQEGLEAGRQEGLEAGRQEGLEAGRQEGLEAGRQEGLLEGRQEGSQQTKTSIIRNMLCRGYSDADICMLAECSQDTLNKIRENENQ